LYQGSTRSISSSKLTDPNPTRLHDHKAPNELLPVFPHEFYYCFGDGPSSRCREAKEQDTWRCQLPRINQLAEVLIFGQHDASFTNRKINHGFILSPRRNLRNSHNIVAIGAKGADYREVTAFIGKEVHRFIALIASGAAA
jgi:hypothetical protein